MPDQPSVQGAHVDIPAVSSISGQVAMHNDSVARALWTRGGSLFVFAMAAALPILPLVLLVLLLRESLTNANGLFWLWIAMGVITELIAFLVAYGLVRSVLEGEA